MSIMVKKFQHRWETLKELIEKYDCKNIAEIGVLEGENARNLLKICPQIEQMFLIDPYVTPGGTHTHINDKFYGECARKQTSFLKMTSKKAAEFFKDGSLDLVFIDGDHRYPMVSLDIDLWLPKIRKGGIICGHDYNWEEWYPGIQKAVDEKFDTIYYIPDEKVGKDRSVWWVEL